jgi:hypothetical protein
MLLESIRHIFRFHPPPDDQTKMRHAAIRKAAETFAAIIVVNTPRCIEQEQSIAKVREAMFYANAAIACYPNGVFSSLPEAAFDDQAFIDAARAIDQAIGRPTE